MFDRDKVWERAGSQDLLIRLINKLSEIVPRTLGQIEQARAQGDAHALERGAHSLRGALATFEAPEPVALARQVEAMALEGRLEEVPEVLERLRLSATELVRQLLEFARSVEAD